MITKKFTAIYAFILALLIAFSCIVFAACGEEPASPPEPEPTPTPSTSVVTKSFTFKPIYGGEYIFFDNVYFEELYVTTNGEEIYPSAEGEYLLASHTPYVISFKGCKELSYELTYDISDDREVTLSPGEERIVKLGKMYDEIKTITTDNDDIKITGIYRGTPDDLNSYGIFSSEELSVSEYTLPWRSGEYYVMLENIGNITQTAEIKTREQINVVPVSEDGTAYAEAYSGGNSAEVIKFCDLPAGNYLLDVQSSNGSVDMDVYCDGLEYTNGMSTGKSLYFTVGDNENIYLILTTHSSDTEVKYECTLERYSDFYYWLIDGVPWYNDDIYLAQGDSIEIGYCKNGEEIDHTVRLFYSDGRNEKFEGTTFTLAPDHPINIDIDLFACTVSGGTFSHWPHLNITPVLAEPFTGVTFETSNGRTLMTWENVPNLYSFKYSINGGEERKVLISDVTSLDITSYISENVRRALVEITYVTYSYPVYDDSGEPTGETRKVVHDDVMKYVVEY